MGRSYLLLLGFVLLLNDCTEPFDLVTVDFDELLIVEGSITDEMKKHELRLSRSVPLENFEPKTENQAVVSVEGSDGSLFKYSQDTDAVYRANEEFRARPDVTYILNIETQSGQSYVSDEVTLPPPVEIDRVFTEFNTQGGRDGIEIFVDSEDAGDDVQYFRYEFEETYEIEVPKPSNWSWEIADYDFRSGFYELDLTRRVPQTICYSTKKSSGIFQTSTAGLEKRRVSRFSLHYIHRRDPVLRERYSILVRQFTQSLPAHTFFRTLQDLGASESLLSQGQPGFLPGNVTSLSNIEEKVLGYFEASAVTSKRIYFNYQDFGLEFPPYFNICEEIKTFPTAFLIRKLEVEDYQIADFEEDGPIKLYKIFRQVCTDCTTFSSNVKPDFWED